MAEETPWTYVASSNVLRFRYLRDPLGNESLNTLEVTFDPTTDKTRTGPRSGKQRTYQLIGVPESTFQAFERAESKGSYYYHHLRYQFQTLGPY